MLCNVPIRISLGSFHLHCRSFWPLSTETSSTPSPSTVHCASLQPPEFHLTRVQLRESILPAASTYNPLDFASCPDFRPSLVDCSLRRIIARLHVPLIGADALQDPCKPCIYSTFGPCSRTVPQPLASILQRYRALTAH